jgi:hypothetical protein
MIPNRRGAIGPGKTRVTIIVAATTMIVNDPEAVRG